MPIDVDDVNRLAGGVLQCLHDVEYRLRAASHGHVYIGGLRPALRRQHRAQDVGASDTKRLTDVQQGLTNTRQQLGLFGSQPPPPIPYHPVADTGVESGTMQTAPDLAVVEIGEGIRDRVRMDVPVVASSIATDPAGFLPCVERVVGNLVGARRAKIELLEDDVVVGRQEDLHAGALQLQQYIDHNAEQLRVQVGLWFVPEQNGIRLQRTVPDQEPQQRQLAHPLRQQRKLEISLFAAQEELLALDSDVAPDGLSQPRQEAITTAVNRPA